MEKLHHLKNWMTQSFKEFRKKFNLLKSMHRWSQGFSFL